MEGIDMVPNVRWRSWALAALSVAAAACTGTGEPGPGSSVPPGRSSSTTAPDATSSTTATTVADVSVIPAVVDQPYLQAVLDKLDQIDSEAARAIAAAKRFVPEAQVLIRAIYGGDEAEAQVDLWFQELADDPDLANIRPRPGNSRTRIERLISTSPACSWMAVRRDLSAVSFDPGPDRVMYVALAPLDQANDPQDRNPTAWMITAYFFLEDASEPPDPCR